MSLILPGSSLVKPPEPRELTRDVKQRTEPENHEVPEQQSTPGWTLRRQVLSTASPDNAQFLLPGALGGQCGMQDIGIQTQQSTKGSTWAPLLCSVCVCEREQTTAPMATGGVSQEGKLEMPFCHLPCEKGVCAHKRVGILHFPGTREEQLCRCFSTFCNSPEL